MDFSVSTRIGERIKDGCSQLKLCNGYDHNYVLDRGEINAEVHGYVSGRMMKILTDKLGLQFYSGNYLNNIRGRGGVIYRKNFGLCLETQLFPDSPNHKNFSDCILKKDRNYSYKTVYQFGIK